MPQIMVFTNFQPLFASDIPTNIRLTSRNMLNKYQELSMLCCVMYCHRLVPFAVLETRYCSLYISICK